MIETEFLEYVVKQIVAEPAAVKIARTSDARGELLMVEVAPADAKRVIGYHGSVAQSLRSLLRALAVKNNAHYNLKIIDAEKDAEDVENTTENSRNSDEKSAAVENSNTENAPAAVENPAE